MSENELKAIVDAANRRVEVVVPEGFVVMVNGVRIVPALDTEQNPAKHRDELPDGTGLVVNGRGTKFWFLNGKRHCEDGPAVEYANGHKEWWVNGKMHREDGPAIEWAGGSKEWWVNGELHREDGPALEYSNGEKEWFQNGERHRVDGPAVEWSNGYKEWWVNGERMTEAEFLVATQKNGKNDPEGTAKTTDSTITSGEFPVGSEQNPAKHRDELPDGTGIVVNFSGIKTRYKNWRLHCENGPAFEWADGTKAWYKNGKLHREDGPAVEWMNGTKEWYRDGVKHREDGPAVEWSNGDKEWYLNGEKMTEAEFLERTQ